MVVLSDAIRSKVGDCLKKKAKSASEQERTQLLGELTVNCESRYRTSLDSINRANNYMTWMVEAGSTSIPIEEQEKYTKFFELKKRVAEQKAVEASDAEKEISAVVENGTFSEQVHHALIKNYFHTKNGQITVQKQIFEKETELGNIFIQFVQQYLQRFARQINEKTPDQALTLAKALKLIKQDSLDIRDILQLNYQAMLNSVGQLHDHLGKRQDKLAIMKKAILHLNEVVDVMAEEEIEPEPKAKSTNRMAFTSK